MSDTTYNPFTRKLDVVGNIPDGTAEGQLTRWNNASKLWDKVDEMIWDDVNKRLGLLTSSPLASFDTTPDSVGVSTFTRPFPSITTAERNALTNLVEGAGVWDSEEESLRLYSELDEELKALNAPSNQNVYSADDLPAAVGGKISLTKRYTFDPKTTIYLTDELVVENGGLMEYANISTSQKVSVQNGGVISYGRIEYTGTGDVLGSATTTIGSVNEIYKTIITANNATIFNMSSSVPAFLIIDGLSLIGNGNALGNITKLNSSIKTIGTAGLTGTISGLTFTDNIGIDIDLFGLPNGMSSPGTIFTFTGTSQGTIQLGKLLLNNSGAGVYAYNFDPATNFTQPVSNNRGYVTDGDKAFAAGSDTQYSPGFTFSDVGNIPNTTGILFSGIDSITPISAADITIDYNTRILTITPPLGYFYFYTDGGGTTIKHTKIGAVNFPAFPDVTGSYRFYFDNNGDPQYTTGDLPSYSEIAPVYRVLWNSTLAGSAKAVAEVFECHQNTVSWIDHAWKNTLGTIWEKGGVLAATPTTGTPNASGVNTCIGLTTISNIDDNLEYTIENSIGGGLWQQVLGETTPANITTANSGILDIPYLAGGVLPSRLTGTRFPFSWDIGTNRPEYITTGGTRTLVSDLSYFVYFVFALQDSRTGKAIMTASSGAEYSTITDARAVTWEYMQSISPLLADKEVRPLYKLIFRYRTIYPPEVKYTSLYETVDLRKAAVTQTTATGSLPASSITTIAYDDITATNLETAKQQLANQRVKGTGTTNYIPKFTGTSSIGNSLIYDNGTYVGVRTASSSNPLTVRGTVSTKENAIRWERGLDGAVAGGLGYYYDTENSIAVGSITNHKFKLYTNDITRLTIDTNGNVGIGTLSPSANFDANPTTITTSSYTRPWPVVTTTQRNALTGVPVGAVVWDTTLKQLYIYDGSWIAIN